MFICENKNASRRSYKESIFGFYHKFIQGSFIGSFVRLNCQISKSEINFNLKKFIISNSVELFFYKYITSIKCTESKGDCRIGFNLRIKIRRFSGGLLLGLPLHTLSLKPTFS